MNWLRESGAQPLLSAHSELREDKQSKAKRRRDARREDERGMNIGQKKKVLK